ncbi:malate dehydrogenase [Blastopirellula marina]|uniref:Lactate dehydrogenase n=1 Tax=Blastopirellula marina TaxID=124 RepID=A0A2S8F2S3_9BACT|nr:lactate dehydrogenase [Blastopirellula marina]PQO26450.1 lactate dehydrogenase [Blastopirellula marina]PQO46915.1 lactate dehydrogenase [Blastopirellula marina]PTL40763.1 lactate dehydrogenase [Blastopirellula marina]
MKVSLVGLGKVGSAVAHAIVLKGLADELVLVSRRTEIAKSEADDLNHAAGLEEHSVDVRAGGDLDTADSDVILYCDASPAKSIDVDRYSAARDNLQRLHERIPTFAAGSPQAICVMVTNPVDVMTWFALQMSGFPQERVFGVGTLLDTARLRRLLSEKLSVHASDVRAYVIGEHGEDQVASFSTASLGGESMKPSEDLALLARQAAESAGKIYRTRGFTNYGIAGATMMILESIRNNRRRTAPVSMRINDYYGVKDVCLSLPAVIGRRGIERVLRPELNEAEQAAFHRGASRIREAIEVLTPSLEAVS